MLRLSILAILLLSLLAMIAMVPPYSGAVVAAQEAPRARDDGKYSDAIPKEDKAEVEMTDVQQQDLMRSRLFNLEYLNAVEKYGDGPHRVMFSLEFPAADANSKPERRRFFVETAPLRSAPHTVGTFLDMVKAGLYNGVWFNAVTENGLVAVDFGRRELAPAASDRILRRLEQADKHESALVYKEYSPDVPRGRGTMGFLERGPGIFVNTKQENRVEMEGQPCFGRVVEGLDVLEMIAEKGVGAWADPITIRIARIVTPTSPEL